jgi:hypothetical protein
MSYRLLFLCVRLQSKSVHEDNNSASQWKRIVKVSTSPLKEPGGVLEAADRWRNGGTRLADHRWVFSSDLDAARFLGSRYIEFSDG